MDTGLSKEGHEDTKSARTVESVWSMGGRAWWGVMGGMTVAIREPERGQKRQAGVVGIRTLGGGDSGEDGILGNDEGGQKSSKWGLWTSSISMAWELRRNADTQAPPQTSWSRGQSGWLRKPPRGSDAR